MFPGRRAERAITEIQGEDKPVQTDQDVTEPITRADAGITPAATNIAGMLQYFSENMDIMRKEM